MNKKYLITSILTITLLFASFHIQQKKAEAVVPLAVWVALNVAATIAVGMIFMFTDDDGSQKMTSIQNVNTATGQVDLGSFGQNDGIDFNTSEMRVYTSGDGKSMYPVTTAMLNMNLWPETTGWAQLNNEQMSQALANNITGANVYWWMYQNQTNQYGNSVRWRGVTNPNYDYLADLNSDPFSNIPVSGGLGNKYSGNIGLDSSGVMSDIPVDFYEFEEDVPQLPDCFDGIQNQDETGIDCGGVCEFNFGFVCPQAETCFDGIMNQDETGIDFGGVCGTGNPVAPPPGNFTDDNVDGVDDISGLDSGGNVPVAVPGTGNASTYDASLPGDVSEIGETDWTGLITGYLSSNPLVLLATGSQINVTGATCSLPLTLFGKSMTIDFCSLDWMVDLFGSFVLGLMAIRAVFIAMGV